MTFNIHPLQQAFDLLYKEMTDLYHESAVSMKLSDSAQMVLYTICELGDGCLQKDICDRCYLTKQTVHSAVRKLEQEGFVTLTAGRGRDMHLSLTAAGHALAQKTVFPLAEAERRAMAGLSSREQEELLRLTQKYVSAFRQELRQTTFD